MPAPIALNLARIVHRLLEDPRGWRVDRVREELEIAPRTYRKYRELLRDHFESERLELVEVEQGEHRWLRLAARRENTEARPEFLGEVASWWFARRLMGFGGALGSPLEDAWALLIESIEDRPFYLGHLFRNLDRMLHHVPDAPKDYSDRGEDLALILRALFHCRALRFEHGERSREILPLTLVLWKSGLYVVGDEEDRRLLFAVDRMSGLTLTRRRFRYPADYDPSRLFEGSFGIWQSEGGEDIEVDLVFAAKPWLHRYLRERRWHPTQIFEDLDDGRLRMQFRVASMVEVEPWIRSFGGDVESRDTRR